MNMTDFLVDSMVWIEHSGWLGITWFVVLYSLTCVLFLPGSFLTIGAGAIYGFWLAVPLVTLSNALGAAASFVISRYLARDWMQRRLADDPRMHALERALGREGWTIILLSRVSPIVPHSLVSYAAGLTNISFWRFFIASFIGFIPISVGYAYMGAILGVAVRDHTSLTPRDPLSWTLYIGGLVATVAVMIMVTRASTSAWKRATAENQSSS